MRRLTQIANLHTVDKGTEYYEKHGYTEQYDLYIPETGEFTLLEIGIWHGDSLRMWNEYNPQLNIHAIDIDTDVYNYVNESDKIKIYIGNQSDEVFLNNVLKKSGTPDFIIDDGSHNRSDIVNSFKVLYDCLADGGYYFIEDLHAGHAQVDEMYKDIMSILSDKSYQNIEWLCDKKLLVIHK
jgi:cephalosporin hydroxylase